MKTIQNPRITTMSTILLGLLISVMPVLAQNPLKGRVTTEKGESVPGAAVILHNTTVGTSTDIDGYFSLDVPSGRNTLDFSCLGFIPVSVLADGTRDLAVVMKEDANLLNELVVVGYGTQNKATLTGAVSAINNRQLESTKSMNVENMLTGKLPGVRITQKTSEPGTFNNIFDIRGFGNPLIIVDGVPRDNFDRMNPSEIESISVLKDASAAVYGVQAANGVLLITTKKGEEGKATIEYDFSYGIQVPTNLAKPVGAIDRMTLWNEKTMHNYQNPKQTYTQEDFDAYLNGEKTSTDWYSAIIKNAGQRQHNINVSGGGKKFSYFTNFGYSAQDGFWKTGDLNYDRYNIRANFSAEVLDGLTATVRMNGILDEKNSPDGDHDSWFVFKQLWKSSTNEPFYANDNQDYYYKVSAAGNWNVLPLIDSDVSGYQKTNNKWFQSTFELKYIVPFVKGLSLKATYSYDTSIMDYTKFKKQYSLYTYDAAKDQYKASTKNSPQLLKREYGAEDQNMYNISIYYNRTFADRHNVSALLLMEQRVRNSDQFYAQRNLSLAFPYLFTGMADGQEGGSNSNNVYRNANRGYVGKFNYDYSGKYLAEFSFRYDGSSKFASSKQWGFFPGGSLGWRISEENFIKNTAAGDVIDNLKLRLSAGLMGDDSASSYQFITGYDYPFKGNPQKLPDGSLFNGSWVSSLGFRAAPNPNITWFTVLTLNAGLDWNLWNGKLTGAMDFFQRDRDGLLATRSMSVPGTFGSAMPQENLNGDRTRGLEIQLGHRNNIGDFSYNVTANASFTRTMRLHYEEAQANSSYQRYRDAKSDRYNDILWGYGYNGQYESYNQIANSPVFADNGVLPGDYLYEDWNGDGTIDDKDVHPIGITSDSGYGGSSYRNSPLVHFGLSFDCQYKGFDLNLLFSGAALSFVGPSEQMDQPFRDNGNALDVFLDRWHPSDSEANPYDPTTEWIDGQYAYTGTIAKRNSAFSMQDASYIRLKSIEVGYTIPRSIMRYVGAQSFRLYLNAYNPLTITGLKGSDPEHPSDNFGYVYPLSQIYSFGINLLF